MAARGHFVFPIDAKNLRVLVIRDLNGYGEYEFYRCICDKVMTCTSVGHNITNIFKFREYDYLSDYLSNYLSNYLSIFSCVIFHKGFVR